MVTSHPLTRGNMVQFDSIYSVGLVQPPPKIRLKTTDQFFEQNYLPNFFWLKGKTAIEHNEHDVLGT